MKLVEISFECFLKILNKVCFLGKNCRKLRKEGKYVTKLTGKHNTKPLNNHTDNITNDLKSKFLEWLQMEPYDSWIYVDNLEGQCVSKRTGALQKELGLDILSVTSPHAPQSIPWYVMSIHMYLGELSCHNFVPRVKSRWRKSYSYGSMMLEQSTPETVVFKRHHFNTFDSTNWNNCYSSLQGTI